MIELNIFWRLTICKYTFLIKSKIHFHTRAVCWSINIASK